MMRKLVIALTLVCQGLVFHAAAQTVQGVITSSEDKDVLIGASVFVASEDLKKTAVSTPTVGVITNIDGHFELNLPEGVTRFYCSYLGYEQQEVKLKPGQTTYNITLHPSATMLEAVVVTGYQTIERRKLTAAVSKLDITDEKIGAVRSIDQALSGQIAGLSAVASSGAPGAPVKIRIRGTSSLNGTQDPLWVLDGIPMEGTDIPKMDYSRDIDDVKQSSIAGLNPSDIASITVLKDAAATAIYGARAANGVIVITTKSGQRGKTKVNFNAKLSYMPTLSIDRMNLMNSEEKVGLELDLLQTGYPFRPKKGEVARIINRHSLLENFQSGGWDTLTPQAQAEINSLRATQTDWNDILFRDAFNQEYNLSLSGGSEKATYYTSLGYFKENGNIQGVSADRLNLVAKTSYQVNKMLKIGASLFANRRKNNSFLRDGDGLSNPTFYARAASPYLRPYDDKGNYLYDIDIKNDEVTDLLFNVFEERNNTTNVQTVNAISAIVDAELRINDQFKITSQLGVQSDQTDIERIADQESFSMRTEREKTKYWDSADKQNKYYMPDGGMQKKNHNSLTQITWKAMGEYRTAFNDIHELEAMVGTELRKTWSEQNYSAGYGFDRKTLLTRPIMFPSQEEAAKFPLHTQNYVENAYVSAFSTLSYSLLNKYTLGGSIRFDGSDLFGVDKRYRYLPLYSVSALWRAGNESWLQDNAKWLDNLVFRISYGLQGNIDKNTSPYLLGKYRLDTILPDGYEDMIDILGAPNDKLRWEKTHSFNAGMDLAVLNQAITLSADYYYRKGVDLIGTQSLPLETGFTSSTINWASMENQGIELSLTTRNIHTKNFMWYTNFNFALNRNKVLQESYREDARGPQRIGHPVGAVFTIKTDGVDDEGYPMFINKEGKRVTGKEMFKLQDFGFGATELSAAEQRDLYDYAGTVDAPYTGGITNTFTFKAFELGINCAFNLGGVVQAAPSYSITDYDKGRNSNRDILNRWTPTNTTSRLPGLISSENFDRIDEFVWYSGQTQVYNSLDIWTRKVNYLRIQNIRLGYKLPTTFTRLFGMEGGNFAIEGRNLFVFGSGYRNFVDPETMGNLYAQPLPKSFTFSVSLNF